MKATVLNVVLPNAKVEQLASLQGRARQGEIHADASQRAEELAGSRVREEVVATLAKVKLGAIRNDGEAAGEGDGSAVVGHLAVDHGHDWNLGVREASWEDVGDVYLVDNVIFFPLHLQHLSREVAGVAVQEAAVVVRTAREHVFGGTHNGDRSQVLVALVLRHEQDEAGAPSLVREEASYTGCSRVSSTSSDECQRTQNKPSRYSARCSHICHGVPKTLGRTTEEQWARPPPQERLD